MRPSREIAQSLLSRYVELHIKSHDCWGLVDHLLEERDALGKALLDWLTDDDIPESQQKVSHG